MDGSVQPSWFQVATCVTLGEGKPAILETFCKLLHSATIVELRSSWITPSDKELPESKEVTQLHRQGRCSFDSSLPGEFGTIPAR